MKNFSRACSRLRVSTIVAIFMVMAGAPALGQNVTVSGAATGNGSYVDLSSAFSAINGGSQSGVNISVSITGNTSETVTAVLNAGSWSSFVISPSGGNSVTVTGSLNGPLIELNGASNVRIDGLNTGGNALVLTNPTATTTAATIKLLNGAASNTITNTTILGASTAATVGTIWFSTSTGNGNSNNIISGCVISAAAGGNPVNGIYSAGTSTAANTTNVVQNNSICDYFAPHLATSGILADAGSEAWNISANRFYQTAPRTYTVVQIHKAIFINSGSGYTISANTIGYSSPVSTGLTEMTGTVGVRYVAVQLSASTVAVNSVQGNTVSAISLTTSANASTANGILCGIYIAGGDANIGTIAPNIIGGATGTDHLTGHTSGASGMVVGISASSTGAIDIRNNTIGGLSAASAAAGTACGLAGINVSAVAASLSIIDNIIGTATPANMKAGTSGVTTAATNVSGINLPSTANGTVVISGNSLRNFVSYGTGTGYLRAIWTQASSGNSTTVYSITANTISDLSGNCAATAVSNGQAAILGINLGTGGNNVVASNTVSNLAITNTAAVASFVVGITHANATNSTVRNNVIYNITNASSNVTTPPVAAGIVLRSGTTNLWIYNNMISLGAGSSNNTSFIGIQGNHGSTPSPSVYVYYNTINIQGAVTSGTLPTFGLHRGDLTTTSRTVGYDIRNNLITNTRTGGTGAHYAIGNNFNNTTSSATGWSSNYNVLNADPATVGHWTTAQNLAGWRTASSSDANSFSGVAVTYVNAASDLHLNMGTTPNVIESGAQAIAGYSTDIDGHTRPGPAGSVNGGGVAPDIGADEFDGVILDVVAPVLSHTSPGNTCSGSDRTLTVAVVDAGGVPSTGTLQPRIYFSKNAGSYFSSQGVLTSGTANNGIWSFTISAGTLSGLTGGDVVSYYFVAQDVSTPPNIGASPLTGFAATDVNNITNAPSSPHTYSVLTAISGTYTVGSVGNFTTLTDAAYAYNTSCLTGPVTFMLTDALYSTAETFPVVFQNNPDASATNSLLIRPASSVSAVVSGTNASAAGVIKFLNARYITVDGINSGGANLTLVNPNSGNSAAVWLASSGTGNNFIGIRNLSIQGGGNTTSTNYGIVAGNEGTTPGTTAGADNDNITIEGVSIERVFRGIWATGSASVSAGGLDNWNISGNLVGPALSGTNNLGGVGVFLNGALNATISGNHVRHVSAAVTATTGGIWLLRSTGASVMQNTVNTISSSSSPTGVNAISGINVGNLTNNSTIERNVISGIENTNTSGYGARGLILNNATAINVRNNMISDISGYSDESPIYWVVGIAMEGSTGGVNLDFNSVNLFGSHAGLNFASFAVGLFVNADGGSLNVRNNIFSNTYDNSTSSTDSSFAILSAKASSVFATIDHNAYHAAGGAFTAPGHLGSPKSNLAAIQTAFGGNVNSVIGAPVFNSNTDLHIQLIAPNVLIENEGTPVSGISVDIDLQARNGTTPDIGADEFTIPTCSMVSGGIVAPSSASACAGQTLVAASSGANSGLGSTYQWRYSTVPGGPYVDVVGGSGAATTSYTSAALPAGVYYVVMTSTCAAVSASATSNEATLTVHAVPTATAGASTASICSGNSVTLSGGTNIGSGFMWMGPNNYTSAAQNPVIASIPYGAGGTYSFVTTNMACASPVATVGLIVEGTPSSITVTPTSSLVCAGDSAMYIAQGGHMPSIAQFTDQVQQNTSTTYPAPYTVYYGGQKMQFLVLASELSAQGLYAGPMTAIQFPVVSMGANWGSSLMHLENFQVSVGHTALTSVGATFQGGLTVVSPASNFTPVVGYNNMHVFSTPFVWDGVSNIIVETVFSNNFGGASADHVIQYNTPTTFQSTMLYRADNQTFSSISAATGTNLAVPLRRPDFKLHGIGQGPFAWAPFTGLSSTSSATINAAPGATTIYTVSVTNGACASSNTAVVNVTQLPVLTITAVSDTLCFGDGTNITASGANSYTWSTQQTVSTISVQPASTTVYTVSTIEAPCPVVSKTVEIVVNPLPQVTISPATASVCLGSPITFSAAGASSFAWSTSSVNDTIVLLPLTTTTVMVLGTDQEGCTATAMASVNVMPLPTVNISMSAQQVCAGSTVTLTGIGANTYSWSNGATTPVNTFTAGSSGDYSVTGTDANGCQSTALVNLQVDPLPQLSVTGKDTICNGDVVQLDATGANSYFWMPGNGSGASFTIQPAAPTVYTVTGIDSNSCANTHTVLIFVEICTGVADGGLASRLALYPNPGSGMLTADLPFEGVKQLLVMNAAGALVAELSSSERRVELDLTSLAKGIYFVRVLHNGNSATVKVIIE